MFDLSRKFGVLLDGTIAWAHVSLAATYWCYNCDLARAYQEIQRSIDLDPKLAKVYHFPR